MFCAKLHAFKLFSQIVSALNTKDNRTIEGRIELLKMALSMNITTNRSKDRKELLFSLLGVSETKDIEFIENTIANITSPITDNNIAGIIDGDGSFYISFNKNGLSFSITSPPGPSSLSVINTTGSSPYNGFFTNGDSNSES